MTALTDPDYSRRGWIAELMCQHPSEKLELQGCFPPENPDRSVFACRCLRCGSRWDHTSTGVPWDQLLIKIAMGAFTVTAEVPEARDKLHQQLQERRFEFVREADDEPAPTTVPGDYRIRHENRAP